MLSYEEALEQLLAAACPVSESKSVPLVAARGRVLAQAQVSAIHVPPLDNSAMDGYALRCADVAQAGVALPVTQRIPAGTVGQPLQPGTAARIFTGAPVPPGADAVVMQEKCAAGDGSVTVQTVPKPGDNIRRAGEDILAGAAILPAGVRLGPAELGLAASVGLATLPVLRRLRVALLSTGDELVEPGEPLPPGAIYNSNRYFLRALLEGLGCVVTDLGRIPDTLAATREALRTAAESNDLILSTGGVSVGEEDHVKAAIEAEGRLDLWKIAIKPGKPLAYGKVGAGRTASFIGLPGNPVAGFITFLILVRPFILRSMGTTPLPLPVQRRVCISDWPKADPKRREFLRARLLPDGQVELHPRQGSGVLSSCAWADGLIDTPAGGVIRAGDEVSYIALDGVLS
ncbi:MAG: molybdopterin molybdotransferase MoeA [Rhodocyclaceae bacterium]|nr:molybdopterin molybdotransferase MoeA [Rhodocyclaceae bacterium]MDZ4213470.1 gephyrin-like molybdotransferase Glp [Rhodocyclaceae bacterium]